MSVTIIRRVEPPTAAPRTIDEDGQHTPVWADYHQAISDAVAAAQTRKGVTDGSDAVAGDLGEYLSASGSSAFASNTPGDIATLPLTAGDWDVRGQVAFSTTLGILEARAWISSAAASPAGLGESVISLAGTGSVLSAGTQLLAGPARFSLSASATIHLGALARFTSGTASASGTISARRVR